MIINFLTNNNWIISKVINNKKRFRYNGIYLILWLWLFGSISTIVHNCDLNNPHALILARSGSKGIRHKNLLIFNGTTILSRTIHIIKKSKLFSNIWVSTDSDLIEQEALKSGALVFRRSYLYAQDNSSSFDALKEFSYQHSYIQRFALFQCTSIFLKTSYIREAIHKFANSSCVFAVTRSHHLRWQFQYNEQKWIPLNFNLYKRPRRQDWNGEFIETGMFYFFTKRLLQTNRIQDAGCQIVEIKANDALEIDTMDDWYLAQCLLSLN